MNNDNKPTMNERQSMFAVELVQFDELTAGEQENVSNNGSGKEYANYVRVTRNGDTAYLESDAMEAEDARFSRDLGWVVTALRFAYQCGVTDGAESNVSNGELAAVLRDYMQWAEDGTGALSRLRTAGRAALKKAGAA